MAHPSLELPFSLHTAPSLLCTLTHFSPGSISWMHTLGLPLDGLGVYSQVPEVSHPLAQTFTSSWGLYLWSLRQVSLESSFPHLSPTHHSHINMVPKPASAVFCKLWVAFSLQAKGEPYLEPPGLIGMTAKPWASGPPNPPMSMPNSFSLVLSQHPLAWPDPGPGARACPGSQKYIWRVDHSIFSS